MNKANVNYSKSDLDNIENEIIQARNDYYNGTPKLSDAEYDIKYDILKTHRPKSKAITAVGAPVVSSWAKVRHNIPMGSLDKCQTPAEMEEWILSLSDDANKCGLFCTLKLDGISIELLYKNGLFTQAITRGSGLEGEDITSNVKKMSGVPHSLNRPFTGSVRGEIILLKSKEAKHFPNSANPRNTASGTAKRYDGTGSEHLNVMVYEMIGNIEPLTEEDQFNMLADLGFDAPESWVFVPKTKNFIDEIKLGIKQLNKHWDTYQEKDRKKLDFDIDGLVIRVNDISIQLAMGDKDMRPKGARAYKFRSDEAVTTIRGITWQAGSAGTITPVANVDPTKLCGATITNASLYNIGNIENLGLDIGAQVLLIRSNDVIPVIKKLIKGTGSVASPPSTCPSCGSPTTMKGAHLVCENVDECPAQVIGRISTWVDTLNLLDWGTTLMEKLVTTGKVKHVSDLYKLTISDLEQIDRMGQKSAKKVYDVLWAAKEITLEQLFGGLGIHGIGTSTIELITDAGFNSIDKIFKLSLTDLLNIKGLGDVRAASLVSGIAKNKKMVEEMLTLGVSIKKKGTKFASKSFCFTGSSTLSRKELEQMVIDNGGKVKGVSKDLTYLVMADANSTSSKAVNARKLGIKLISEEEFVKMA